MNQTRPRNDDACPGSGLFVQFDDRVTNHQAHCPTCDRVIGLTWRGVIRTHGYTMGERPPFSCGES